MFLLEITSNTEFYDEEREVFVNVRPQTIQLEHSLISVSKWESKWHRPFLGKDDKTPEETIDYIRCMTITKNVPPETYYVINAKQLDEINAYLENPMTATWFNEKDNKKFSKEIITAELIYYWMITLQIPFQCEQWHLNRLLTLIRVCNAKNEPSRQMSRKEVASSYRAMNAARRKRYGSRG